MFVIHMHTLALASFQDQFKNNPIIEDEKKQRNIDSFEEWCIYFNFIGLKRFTIWERSQS